MIRGILDFIDAKLNIGFDVAPKEAISYFKAKELRPSFSYMDVYREEHVNAFTVAKMADMDLLKDVQDSLYAAMADGLSYEKWADRLIPTLQANGWWGRQAVKDPVTGQTIIAELGSARRLQTIFRTNMQNAYSVGKWQRIMEQAEQAPYLMYDAIDDFRTRPQHRAWDNTVLPITDKFWRRHYPPNGWGCRCGVIQLSQDDLDAMGLSVSQSPKINYVDWKNPRTGKIEKIPAGIDGGFDFNAGQARYEQLKRLADEKAADMPEELKQSAKQALIKIEAEAKKPVESLDGDNDSEQLIRQITLKEQQKIINDWLPEYDKTHMPDELLSSPEIVTLAESYGLTLPEQMALRYYTGTGHAVNAYLLDHAPADYKRYKIERQGADLLRQALNKLPVYQGVAFSRMTLRQSFVDKMIVGDTVLFPAFTSADYEADSFAHRKHRLIIDSLTARNIKWISEHADTESEVLFNSPTWFKVIHIEYKLDNEIWFYLREVSHE